VEGEQVSFSTKAKAILGHKDVTAELAKLHVGIATFGHFNERIAFAADIRSASAKGLIASGLLYPQDTREEGRNDVSTCRTRMALTSPGLIAWMKKLNRVRDMVDQTPED
jgi:hypothetical protein